MKTTTTKDLKTEKEFHFLRKAWHITGVLILFSYLFYFDLSYKQKLISLLFISLFTLFLELLRLRNKKINNFILHLLKPFMRDYEKDHFSGLLPLILGTLIIHIVFPDLIVKLALLFLAFSDPFASYLGLRYGKIKIFKAKTLEGFMGCWVCCSLIVLIFWPYEDFKNLTSFILFSLSAGFIGSVSEILSFVGVNDNFTIPVFSAIGLWSLSYGVVFS